MSTLAIWLVLLASMAWCWGFGIWVGINHERRKAERLTSFAVVVFTYLLWAPEGEYLKFELTRSGDRYRMFVETEAEDPIAKRFARVKPWVGDLPDAFKPGGVIARDIAEIEAETFVPTDHETDEGKGK